MGEVRKIESDPQVHTVYWWPDQVGFINSRNGTSSASRFTVGDVFVDTQDKTYTTSRGDVVRIEGAVLNPSKYLGNV